jgi:hypothetical protein
MDLKYRKLISRCKPLHKILKWYAYNSGIFFYSKLAKKNHYTKFFTALKGSKKGKRCFIIGNGPSLLIEDLNKLKNEDTFAVNEIHKCFPKTTWRPTYYLIMDRYSKSTPKEIREVKCKICFLGSYYWRHNKVLRKDAICLHQHFNINDNKYKFSTDISKYIVNAPTVSYASMQVAAYLGYSEVYLLGFDHSYSFEFDIKGKVINTGQHNTHFYKDEISEDIIANVWGMTKAYEAFRDYAKANNIVVRNATRGGKLNVFERVDFDSIF